MSDPGNLVVTALVGWLVTGLLVQGGACGAQWFHLQRLMRSGELTAPACGYGQGRALFQWLESVERIVRIGLWLGAGWLAALDGLLAGSGYVGGVVYVVVFVFADQCLQWCLPWARWRWVERASGVSRVQAGTFVIDMLRRQAAQTLTAFGAALLVLWPLYTVSGPWQWPVSGLCLLAGAGLWSWARPQLVDPLFHRFSELPAGDLRQRLTGLMRRCGAELDNVLIIDTSRRSRLANAQFTGWGRRKRVVLSDTLIEQLDAAELEAVMAHELGHFQCGHLRRYYALQAVLLWLGWVLFAAGGAYFGVLTGPAFGAVAAYLLLPALAWPLQPWFAALRRRYEYEADAYAAQHADRRALITALERLLANNLGAATMAASYAVMYATHPPADQRLARLRQ